MAVAFEELATERNAELKDPIRRYEQIIDEILRRKGYPTVPEKLRACDRAAMPPEVEEAISIKFYEILPLRKALKSNDALTAVVLMEDLIYSILTIKTRPAVPILKDGVSLMKGRSKGGKAPKKAAGIALLVGSLVDENPSWTARELWAYLQQRAPANDPRRIEGYEIYRDRDLLYEVNDKTGDSKKITLKTFQRYVTNAKKSPHISRSK